MTKIGSKRSFESPNCAETGTSEVVKIKGIRKSQGKWVAESKIPRSRTALWLGRYATQKEASAAYECGSYYLRNSASPYFNKNLTKDDLVRIVAYARAAGRSAGASSMQAQINMGIARAKIDCSKATTSAPLHGQLSVGMKRVTKKSKDRVGVRERKWGAKAVDIRVPKSPINQKIWIGGFATYEMAKAAWEYARYHLRDTNGDYYGREILSKAEVVRFKEKVHAAARSAVSSGSIHLQAQLDRNTMSAPHSPADLCDWSPEELPDLGELPSLSAPHSPADLGDWSPEELPSLDFESFESFEFDPISIRVPRGGGHDEATDWLPALVVDQL